MKKRGRSYVSRFKQINSGAKRMIIKRC